MSVHSLQRQSSRNDSCALSEASLAEHIVKAKQKIEAGDYAGAITNAYTLVEEFLKQTLRKTGADFSASEGDIRKLYKLVAERLGLNPGDRKSVV